MTTISEGFKKHREQELACGLQALIVMNPIFIKFPNLQKFSILKNNKVII